MSDISENPSAQSFKYTVSNDNTGFSGRDDGATYALEGEYRSRDIRAGAGLNAYTQNTEFDQKSRTMLGKHQDHTELYVLHNITRTHTAVGSIVTFGGIGLQCLGEQGGGDIQNIWHKYGPAEFTESGGKRYRHGQKYETDSSGKLVTGCTLDIRGRVEFESIPIIVNPRMKVVPIASSGIKAPWDKGKGVTSFDITVGARTQLDNLLIETALTLQPHMRTPTSSVIDSARNKSRNFGVVSVAHAPIAALGNISPSLAIKAELGSKIQKDDRYHIMLGVQKSF